MRIDNTLGLRNPTHAESSNDNTNAVRKMMVTPAV